MPLCIVLEWKCAETQAGVDTGEELRARFEAGLAAAEGIELVISE